MNKIKSFYQNIYQQQASKMPALRIVRWKSSRTTSGCTEAAWMNSIWCLRHVESSVEADGARTSFTGLAALAAWRSDVRRSKRWKQKYTKECKQNQEIKLNWWRGFGREWMHTPSLASWLARPPRRQTTQLLHRLPNQNLLTQRAKQIKEERKQQQQQTTKHNHKNNNTYNTLYQTPRLLLVVQCLPNASHVSSTLAIRLDPIAEMDWRAPAHAKTAVSFQLCSISKTRKKTIAAGQTKSLPCWWAQALVQRQQLALQLELW